MDDKLVNKEMSKVISAGRKRGDGTGSVIVGGRQMVVIRMPCLRVWPAISDLDRKVEMARALHQDL